MKCTYIFIILCLSLGFTNCANNNTHRDGSIEKINQQPIEGNTTESGIIKGGLQLLAEYKIGSNDFFGINKSHPEYPEYPCSSYLNSSELFLLNEKRNKLIIFNIETKQTTTDGKINAVIEQNAETYYGANQVVVKNGKIYIGFLRAILCISRDGKSIIKCLTDINVDFFFVTKDNDILVFASNNVFLFNNIGERLGMHKLKYSILSNENQLVIDNKIYVGGFDNEIKVYDIERLKNKQDYKEFKIDSSNLPIQEPYLACVTPSYTVWFPYMTRNKMVLLNRETHTLEKTIEFKKSVFAPLEEELATEEGNPNLHIVAKNDKEFYFILGKGGKISIYYLSI